MVGEIVGVLVVFAGVAALGVVAWRLTLRVIGVDQQELALFRDRFREPELPEALPDSSGPSGAAERVERILSHLDAR